MTTPTNPQLYAVMATSPVDPATTAELLSSSGTSGATGLSTAAVAYVNTGDATSVATAEAYTNTERTRAQAAEAALLPLAGGAITGNLSVAGTLSTAAGTTVTGLGWINGKAYGAKGDGATDDTAAIQAALNACPPGGVVFLPALVYRTSAPLTLPPFVTLQSTHANADQTSTDPAPTCSIKPLATFAGAAVIQLLDQQLGGYLQDSREHRIHQLSIDGSALPAGSVDGILATGFIQGLELRDVFVSHVTGHGLRTAVNTNLTSGPTAPYNVRANRVTAYACGSDGYSLTSCTHSTWTDCDATSNTGNGWNLTGSGSSTWLGCRADWNLQDGYLVSASNGPHLLASCSTDRNNFNGVHVITGDGSQLTVSGCRLHRDGRNGGAGGTGGYAGAFITTTNTPVHISDTSVTIGYDDDGASGGLSPQYGFHADNTKYANVTSAILSGATTAWNEGTGNTLILRGPNVVEQHGTTGAAQTHTVPVGLESTSGGAGTFTGTLAVTGALSAATVARNDLGIYVPPGWGSFWRPARAAALAGTGLARVAVVGASLTLGYYASNPLTTSWVGRCATSLQAGYGDGGSGYFGTARTATALGASASTTAYAALTGVLATQSGTWTLGSPSYGPGQTYLTSTTPANSLTFAVRGTNLRIYTLGGGGGKAAWTYTIDGGAAVPVADSGLSSAAIQVTTVSGLATGTHTVVLKHNGTSGQVFAPCGVTAENATGVVMNNFADPGATSNVFSDLTSGNGAPWSGGASYPADLAIYSCAANDANQGNTADTWAYNVRQYLTGVQDTGTATGTTDLMIVLPHIGQYDTGQVYQDICAAARTLAETYNAALINFWALGRNSWNYWNSLSYWGNAATVGAAGTDQVELSDTGHQAMATALLPLLTS